VSVVVPVRNEAEHLERSIAAILTQDYPLPFDVCLAVAPSHDGTEAVAADIASREPRVHIVVNPRGVTPVGLNLAIRATSGDVVVRVDGHAELSAGYIRRAVETMLRTGAVNVGGVQAAEGERPFERAVAMAMTSRLGTGGARFHVGGSEGAVDTVYLGVFDRRAGDAVGWFDESLVRNQDYELNVRLRAAGGLVWFDPALRASYKPRATLTGLARQYYEYGLWKAEVVLRHPGSLRVRQFLPAAQLLVQVAAIAASRRVRPARAVPIAYLSVVAVESVRLAGGRLPAAARITAAVITMHQAWAVGAWRGLAGSLAARVTARCSGAQPSASTTSGWRGSPPTPFADRWS
jgi:glycosyltransferase involved in cell wall biosynthesis